MGISCRSYKIWNSFRRSPDPGKHSFPAGWRGNAIVRLPFQTSYFTQRERMVATDHLWISQHNNLSQLFCDFYEISICRYRKFIYGYQSVVYNDDLCRLAEAYTSL